MAVGQNCPTDNTWSNTHVAQVLCLLAATQAWSRAFTGTSGQQWLPRRHGVTQMSGGRVVFLGSPSCVEVVLQRLWESQNGDFEVCAVVSRPPKRVKKAISKTAVHELAEKLGVPQVLTPPSAKDWGVGRATGRRGIPGTAGGIEAGRAGPLLAYFVLW
eukprot:s2701_g10.t1